MAVDPRTLTIHGGFTYRAAFDWLQNAATPTPIPLTDYVARFSIHSRAGAVPPLIEIDSTSDQVEIEPDGVIGRIRITLTAAQTASLKRSGAYALGALPISDPTIDEYVVSGPFTLVKIGG